MRGYRGGQWLVISVVVLGMALGALAAEGAARWAARDVVTGDDVLIRPGPDKEHGSIGRLYKGMEVKVLEVRGEWAQIELPPQPFSWVKKELLNLIDERVAQVKESGVYVRSGPGTDFAELGQLQQGFKVNVERELKGWCRVTPVEPTGWVHTRYLKETKAGEEVVSPPDTPEPTEDVQTRFQKAEKLLREIIKKPVKDWDFEPAKTIYKELVSEAAYKYVATQRLAYIASLEEAAKERRDLQKRLDQIDKQYEEKIAEIRARATPTIYLAKGTVKKYAVTYVPPATHKLVVEDRITFLLYSSKVDLTQYEGKFVGVTGDLERARAFGASIIRVEKIDVLESE